MVESQVVDAFVNLNETRVLVGCARVLGRPFTIAGGAVRNLLLRLSAREDSRPAPTSLFELVDPLSDIDLVIEDADDGDRLLTLIAARLPVARFHRWEVKTQATRRKESSKFEKIGVDRIEIEISPLDRVPPKLNGLDVDVGAILGALTKQIVELPPVQEAGGSLLRALSGFLKGARYSSYAAHLSVPELASYESMLRDYRRRNNDTRIPSQIDVFRVECQILDLLFTSVSLQTAFELIRQALSFLPSQYFKARGRSRLLSHLRDLVQDKRAASDDAYLSLTLLPSTRGLPIMELQTDQGAKGGGTSWVMIPGTPRPKGSGCCYRDFSLGTAVVIWRRLSDGLPSSLGKALKARLVGGAGYSLGIEERPIALPSIVSTSVASVVRVDHGYVYSVASGGDRLEVALFEIGA